MALTGAVVLVTWFQQRVVNRKKFTTLTGKGNRPRQVPLRWMRWVATGFALAYFAVSVALPMLALIFTAMSEMVYINKFADLFTRLHLRPDRPGASGRPTSSRRRRTRS